MINTKFRGVERRAHSGGEEAIYMEDSVEAI